MIVDNEGREHGQFLLRFNHREQQAEAYCVCGEYETGVTLDAAETALREEHLDRIEPARG